MWHDSVCNTVQEPTFTSTIVAKKTTTWGESGFPSEFLVDSELLRVMKGMYYLGRGGEIYVADRDGVHVKSVRGRINTDITQDHREVAPHRRHTLGRNDMMVAMKSAGLLVYAGWRTLRFPWASAAAPSLR